jgi:hypothetical protein
MSLIENSYLANYINITQTLATTTNGPVGLAGTTLIVDNVTFDAPKFVIAENYAWKPVNIEMLYAVPPGYGSINYTSKIQVLVYNSKGKNIPAGNFRVWFKEQAADFIMPPTQKTPRNQIGSPETGLTNLENWNKYGIAIAGEITSALAMTLSGINGLVTSLL